MITLDILTNLVLLCFFGLVGLCIGSFISVLVTRLPENEPIIFTRSKCPECQHPLAVTDLIPVVSWFRTHGTCRYCSNPISALYPGLELVTSAMFMAIFIRSGLSLHALFLCGFVTVAIPLILIDIKHYILPDSLMIILGALIIWKVGFSPWQMLDGFVSALLAVALAMFLKILVTVWKGQDALGYGDVKLFAIAGWYVHSDYQLMTTFLFIAGMTGLVLALTWRRLFHTEVFPFGPPLILSLLLTILYPHAQQQFYGLFS